MNNGRRLLFSVLYVTIFFIALLFFWGCNQASETEVTTNESTSEELQQKLEKAIARYDHELERLQAVTAIQNCMGYYETIHITSHEIWRTPECFALWRQDCSVEVSDWGCFFGPDAIKGFWESMKPKTIRDGIFWHALATPVIEVAGDGKTAKVVWFSPGFETMPPFEGETQGHKSYWCWGKYGIDFIKNPETGEWKIWHMKWFRTIRNDFYTDWYTDSQNSLTGMPGKGYEHEDRYPSVFHEPYTAGKIPHPFPITPEPYESYDGSFRWIFGGPEYEEKYGVTYPPYEKLYNINYPDDV